MAFLRSPLSSAQTETGLLPPRKAPRTSIGSRHCLEQEPSPRWASGVGWGQAEANCSEPRTSDFAGIPDLHPAEGSFPSPAPSSLEVPPPYTGRRVLPGSFGWFVKVYSERLARRPGLECCKLLQELLSRKTFAGNWGRKQIFPLVPFSLNPPSRIETHKAFVGPCSPSFPFVRCCLPRFRIKLPLADYYAWG